MSKGLGFLQSNIQDMLQDGDTLTVADVMEVAGPDYDPRHIRRAFKSLHRRGKVCLTVKAGCLAVKVKSAPRSPAQGPVADALDASDRGAGQRGSALPKAAIRNSTARSQSACAGVSSGRKTSSVAGVTIPEWNLGLAGIIPIFGSRNSASASI